MAMHNDELHYSYLHWLTFDLLYNLLACDSLLLTHGILKLLMRIATDAAVSLQFHIGDLDVEFVSLKVLQSAIWPYAKQLLGAL